MTTVAGLDLNGWRDVAARGAGQAAEADGAGGDRVIDGGAGGVVIVTEGGLCVGGPQAIHAPHGRGPGWGHVGRLPRLRVSALLEDAMKGRNLDPPEALAAVADALAPGAAALVVAVPDLPGTDEAARGRLLRALEGRHRSVRLLWRPVAAFLDAQAQRLLTPADEGRSFRILLHSGAGLEMQTLKLRRDADHPGHLAPERDGPGALLFRSLGLAEIERRARDALLGRHPEPGRPDCEASALPLRLPFGLARPGDPELLRQENGGWIRIEAPALDPAALLPDPPGNEAPPPGEVEGTFLVTPLAGDFAARLEALLAPRFPGLVGLGPESPARGALAAARLIDRGLPPCFDRLTPIAIAVLRKGEPVWHPLIDPKATLRADREYVAPPVRGLAWGRAKTRLEVYVLKGDREVRHWEVARAPGPAAPQPVELRFRQTPGQSWARITLTAPRWDPLRRHPELLDWERLNPDTRSPDEILAALRPPPPVVPDCVTDLPEILFWTGGGRWAPMDPDAPPDRLAELLSRRQTDVDNEGRPVAIRRPVGSDGSLPPRLDPGLRQAFRDRIEKLACHLLRRTPEDNHPLRCVTWAFTLCPEAVQEELVRAVEAVAAGRDHPFLLPSAGRSVVLQGAGRAVAGTERLGRLFRALAHIGPNTIWTAGLGMALSRRREAPAALDRATVDALADRLAAETRLLADRSEKAQDPVPAGIRLAHALHGVAALCRYRECEPRALVAPEDGRAQAIAEAIGRIRTVLDGAKERGRGGAGDRRRARLVRSRDAAKGVLDLLAGSGTPDILTRTTPDDGEVVGEET